MSTGIPSTHWKTQCELRKQKQNEDIPKEWIVRVPDDEKISVVDFPTRTQLGLLTALERQITETTDIDVLLGNLASGVWSSVAVTTAFYKRAIIAHQLTNCLTEIFVDRALDRARQLDEHLRITGKVWGPLHGLPVSLKDQFHIKGLETIMGYASWVGRTSQIDSVLVQILYDLGAVPFVKTNVPQSLMWGETFNHVFGRTTNPHNRYMTCGGSSGGEGALLALKGSPLGIGTDIGGSVRIPSAFCGLYALRPSYERLPYANVANSLEGQESISSVPGPMANSIATIKRFTKAVLEEGKPWDRDPLVVRKPWSEKEYALKEHGNGVGMCFAIMWDNGVVRPHPPVRRALEIVKESLGKAGHKVIDWVPHRHIELYETAERIFAADGGHDIRTECAKSGEPHLQTMAPEENAHPYPLDQPLFRTLVGEPVHLSAYDLWQLHKKKRDLRKSYLEHWQSTLSQTGTGRPVDAIICPVAPYTACPHGTNSFPVTFSDKELDKPHLPHKFYNHEDEVVYKLYDPELFHGLPVGLQLAGRTQEEEAVIAMTEIVDKAIKTFASSSS